jgi:hypothetical protein
MDDQSIEEANALGDIGFVTEYNGRSTGFGSTRIAPAEEIAFRRAMQE